MWTFSSKIVPNIVVIFRRKCCPCSRIGSILPPQNLYFVWRFKTFVDICLEFLLTKYSTRLSPKQECSRCVSLQANCTKLVCFPSLVLLSPGMRMCRRAFISFVLKLGETYPAASDMCTALSKIGVSLKHVILVQICLLTVCVSRRPSCWIIWLSNTPIWSFLELEIASCIWAFLWTPSTSYGIRWRGFSIRSLISCLLSRTQTID